jgi:hypothetical protein
MENHWDNPKKRVSMEEKKEIGKKRNKIKFVVFPTGWLVFQIDAKHSI